MSIRLRLIAPTLMLTLAPCLGSARGGVEATQLDVVALDNGIPCKRIFFRSSQHFQGTVFVTPRLIAGAGQDGKNIYDISPTDVPGRFILNLRLYFPANDESLKFTGASTFKRDLDYCNWDAVKAAINHRELDLVQKVHTIAPIPLTSIEVSLPGIKETGRIGRSLDASEEVDILDYYGKSLTASFRISAEEKNFFESQLVSPDGIAAGVKLRFQARQRDGSLSARVDAKKLQANLAAKIGGRTRIAKGELATMLAASLDSSSVQISSAAGSAGFEKIQTMIVENFLRELRSAIGVSDSSGTASGAASGNADNSGDLVSVNVALNVLSTRTSREISFNQVTPPESATAEMQVRFRTTRINDPNLVQVDIKARYQDPTLGFSIPAGSSISIAAGFSYTDRIEFEEIRTYLTSSQVKELELHRYFPYLASPHMKIVDEVGSQMPIAKGSYWIYPTDYRWLRVQRLAERIRSGSVRFPSTLDALVNLPVSVTFSALGDRKLFSMADLITRGSSENPYWEGRFEELTGRIILTAKRNLGNLTFRESMSAPTDIEIARETVILDSVVEERKDFGTRSSQSAPAVLKSDSGAILLQKTIVLNVTRPEVLPPAAAGDASEATPIPNSPR